MEIQRKCQWCGKPFIAHTMVTRYCSKSCNEKAYKEKKLEKPRDFDPFGHAGLSPLVTI